MKKITKFSQLESEMFEQLLEEASEQLMNNSCNDFPVDVKPTNKAQLLEFIHSMEVDDDYKQHLVKQVETKTKVYFNDYMVLDVLRAKLK